MDSGVDCVETSWLYIVPVQHDLAEQHVLQGQDGTRVVNGVITLKRFIEIRVGSFEVLFLSMKNAYITEASHIVVVYLLLLLLLSRGLLTRLQVQCCL